MKRMWLAIGAAVLFGCASSNGERQTAPKAAASSADAGAPSAAPSPRGTSASNAPPMTASEAAEKVHEEWIRAHKRAAAPSK